MLTLLGRDSVELESGIEGLSWVSFDILKLTEETVTEKSLSFTKRTKVVTSIAAY